MQCTFYCGEKRLCLKSPHPTKSMQVLGVYYNGICGARQWEEDM